MASVTVGFQRAQTTPSFEPRASRLPDRSRGAKEWTTRRTARLLKDQSSSRERILPRRVVGGKEPLESRLVSEALDVSRDEVIGLVTLRLRSQGLEDERCGDASDPAGHLPGRADSDAPHEPGAIRVADSRRIDRGPNESRRRHVVAFPTARSRDRYGRTVRTVRGDENRKALLELLARELRLLLQDAELVVVADEKQRSVGTREKIFAGEPCDLLARVVHEGNAELAALDRVARHGVGIVRRDHDQGDVRRRRVAEGEIARSRHRTGVEGSELVL